MNVVRLGKRSSATGVPPKESKPAPAPVDQVASWIDANKPLLAIVAGAVGLMYYLNKTRDSEEGAE